MILTLSCMNIVPLLAILQAPAAEHAAAPASPGSRRALELVYDESRERVVLFGGAGAAGGETALDSTWLWDGKRWSSVEKKGPSARRSGSFVFDSKRGKAVLVGGSQGDDPTSPVFDETWLFDGATWTKSTATFPGKRSHFACAYDRKRERVVMVGGMQPDTGRNLNDVWEWDGTAWSRSDALAPDDLFAPQMAFDEKANVLVLTSSRTSDHTLTTRTFDGKSFTKVDESGPAVILSGESLVTLGPSGGVLLFGGFGDKPLGDTWKWDGKSWKKLDARGPAPRLAHAMVYDRKRARVVSYGGEDGKKTFDDLWEFDGRAWKEAK